MIWSRNKGETIAFEVSGIHCDHCESSIRIALRVIRGVRKVTIRKKRFVDVELAKDVRVTREELIAAVEKTGYRVEKSG